MHAAQLSDSCPAFLFPILAQIEGFTASTFNCMLNFCWEREKPFTEAFGKLHFPYHTATNDIYNSNLHSNSGMQPSK